MFLPPVCNKLMYAGQLKIMFVGGPNSRKDYHIQEGEELFFMIKGDLLLKVMEHGKPKDIAIKEGEIFVLPSRIPHSPQRLANTLGLVIERARSLQEFDALRWYTEDNNVLYEEWFNCTDLVTQLPVVIKRFFETEQYKTGIPKPMPSPPVMVDTSSTLSTPISLPKWIEKHSNALKSDFKTVLNKGEFNLQIFGGFDQPVSIHQNEIWLYQLSGSIKVTIESNEQTLNSGDVCLIQKNQTFSVKRPQGTIGLLVTIGTYNNL